MKVLPKNAFGYIIEPIIKEVKKRTFIRDEEETENMTEMVTHEIEETMIDETGTEKTILSTIDEPIEVSVIKKVPVEYTEDEIIYLDGVIDVTEEELIGVQKRTHCFAEDMLSVRPLTTIELVKQIQNEKADRKKAEINNLKQRRNSECFSVINRGELWYRKLTDLQKRELDEWYTAWLDVTKTGIIPETPEWLA